MNDKAFTILNLRSFVGIFSDYGCENTEKSVSLTDSDVRTLLAEEENQNTIRKTESYVFSGFGNGILAAENENDNWKIYHSPILAVYLKDFFCW